MNKYNAYLDWDASNKNTYEIIIEDKLNTSWRKNLENNSNNLLCSKHALTFGRLISFALSKIPSDAARAQTRKNASTLRCYRARNVAGRLTSYETKYRFISLSRRSIVRDVF